MLNPPIDYYDLIASIFQSVASLGWPIAFVVVVGMFRKRIIELLPLLLVKHKDLEVSFRLDQAEKEAELLPASTQTPENRPTPEEISRFEQIAELSPRAAIVERRREIEEAVKHYAATRDIDTSGRSYAQIIRVLRNSEFIDSNTSALLDDLRSVGNAAAHATERDFNKEDALRFGELADRVIARLTILSEPTQISNLNA